jgi:hypothetical protein
MRTVFAVALSVLAAGAQAQSASQSPVSIPPDAVLSAVTSDWNGDGRMDRAILVEGQEERADLYIYVSTDDPNGGERRDLALAKTGAAWKGAMWGTQPSLELSPKGSLLLKSGNDAIGRSRWSQTLTIVYRNGEFLVAGMTFDSRDTLEPKAGGHCDLNLLTGQGIRNGKALKVAAKQIRLADWSDDSRPKECEM